MLVWGSLDDGVEDYKLMILFYLVWSAFLFTDSEAKFKINPA